jgi:DNA-binding transcriptional MerR regulator
MLTIGKLAKHAGVTTDSIRFYERIGLLQAAGKTTSGYRLYSEDAVRRLRFIRHAQRCGFSLPHIRELLSPPIGEASTRTYRLALEKKAELEDTMEALRSMASALSSYISSFGRNGAPVHAYVSDESPLLASVRSNAA